MSGVGQGRGLEDRGPGLRGRGGSGRWGGGSIPCLRACRPLWALTPPPWFRGSGAAISHRVAGQERGGWASPLVSGLGAPPHLCFPCLAGKCRGLRTARKLRSHRRDQKWHDKQYKKAHLGTALKANPFGGASHAKGIVLEKVCVTLCCCGAGGAGGGPGLEAAGTEGPIGPRKWASGKQRT